MEKVRVEVEREDKATLVKACLNVPLLGATERKLRVKGGKKYTTSAPSRQHAQKHQGIRKVFLCVGGRTLAKHAGAGQGANG